MGAVNLVKYTYIHEPSEVIITGYASSHGNMRAHIKRICKENNITMPEGEWMLLGSDAIPEEY